MSLSTDMAFFNKSGHKASPAIQKSKYAMIAEPTGKLCRAFGTDIAEEGLSLRGSFIIDPDGILRAFEVNANNIGRSAKELLRKLQAAAFVREHTEQVCPAGWEPGKETLTPGLDLVGKI